MQVLLSHSGKQHSYYVAKALKEQGSLMRFYTSSYVRSGFLQRYFTKSGNTYWTRRFVDGVAGSDVDANWRFELKEVFLRKIFGKAKVVQDAVYHRDVQFDAYVARKIRKEQADVFWGFQGSSHASLQAANDCGMLSVCELATAHVTEAQKVLGEEARLHPEWADSIDNLEFEPNYQRRLEEEPQRAQKVIAASRFTKQSLLNSGIPEAKIEVLPLGFDVRHIAYSEVSNGFGKRPLRLLYAGTVTQRKGIKYLLEAMKAFAEPDVELHIIGGIQGSGEAFRNYKEQYIYHTPISQHEIFKTYQQYDALVLPTIFEGFGLVIVEAMAAGLPVITTPHSMGPDVITNDINGYVVPVRNVEALQQSIAALCNKTEAEYTEMRRQARQSALSFTWDKHATNLQKLLTAF